MQDFLRRTDAWIEPVEALMRTLLDRAGGIELGPIAKEHLATGGKRLRARLALAAVEALGGEARTAIGWAAACEMFHNATLIHDDLQDGDKMRRGHPTVWVRHGMPQAVNAGDLMLLLPFSAVGELTVRDELRWQLCAAMAKRGGQVIRGQAAELLMGQREDTSWDTYLRTIVGKTAGLFELPVEGGALLAGREPARAVELASAFEALGVLFQVQDDVLDLYGEKGREQVGADLREGKISALVVTHLALCPKERDWLLGVLRKPRDETPQDEVTAVIERFRQSGALSRACELMQEQAATVRSAEALSNEPQLAELAAELCSKILDPIRHVVD